MHVCKTTMRGLVQGVRAEYAPSARAASKHPSVPDNDSNVTLIADSYFKKVSFLLAATGEISSREFLEHSLSIYPAPSKRSNDYSFLQLLL